MGPNALACPVSSPSARNLHMCDALGPPRRRIMHDSFMFFKRCTSASLHLMPEALLYSYGFFAASSARASMPSRIRELTLNATSATNGDSFIRCRR